MTTAIGGPTSKAIAASHQPSEPLHLGKRATPCDQYLKVEFQETQTVHGPPGFSNNTSDQVSAAYVMQFERNGWPLSVCLRYLVTQF